MKIEFEKGKARELLQDAEAKAATGVLEAFGGPAYIVLRRRTPNPNPGFPRRPQKIPMTSTARYEQRQEAKAW